MRPSICLSSLFTIFGDTSNVGICAHQPTPKMAYSLPALPYAYNVGSSLLSLHPDMWHPTPGCTFPRLPSAVTS